MKENKKEIKNTKKNRNRSEIENIHGNKSVSRYLVFWFSQAVSGLGSSMTGFALTLWAHSMTGSALTLSLMTFCNYVPYILASLFAGSFVDRHDKKKIMLTADLIAVMSSVLVLVLSLAGSLQIWHMYLLNCIVGLTNAFQQPASSVAVGQMVPQDKIGQVSGLNSFSGNLIVIVTPVLAAAVYAFGGLKLVLAIDFATFLLAFTVLLCFISIPEIKTEAKERESAFAGCKQGFLYLFQNRGLWYIIITMSFINFVSRLTYENILSPMILERSGGSSIALGYVNAAVGIGGVAGGMLVSVKKLPKDRIKTMYTAAALSFLLGDLVMGLGRNTFFWCIAGFAASVPIPFVMAAENMILYESIPKELQGRIFAVRNALQFGMIPAGILLGGFLADYVFEPMMKSENAIVGVLAKLVGTGEGSGMAVMFLCTGVAGGLFSFWTGRRKELNVFRGGKSAADEWQERKE